MDEIIEQDAAGLLATGTAVTRPGAWQRWPVQLKRQIVAETLAPGASVSAVARRYAVNAGQVYKWRHDYAPGSTGESPPMIPVTLGSVATAPRAGTIEIDLPGGAQVRVCGAVEAAVLRQVLEQLR